MTRRLGSPTSQLCGQLCGAINLAPRRSAPRCLSWRLSLRSESMTARRVTPSGSTAVVAMLRSELVTCGPSQWHQRLESYTGRHTNFSAGAHRNRISCRRTQRQPCHESTTTSPSPTNTSARYFLPAPALVLSSCLNATAVVAPHSLAGAAGVVSATQGRGTYLSYPTPGEKIESALTPAKGLPNATMVPSAGSSCRHGSAPGKISRASSRASSWARPSCLLHHLLHDHARSPSLYHTRFDKPLTAASRTAGFTFVEAFLPLLRSFSCFTRCAKSLLAS